MRSTGSQPLGRTPSYPEPKKLFSASPLRPADERPGTGNGRIPGAVRQVPSGPSVLITRGAVSLNLLSTRSTHKPAGSSMCESAEITRSGGIVLSSFARRRIYKILVNSFDLASLEHLVM